LPPQAPVDGPSSRQGPYRVASISDGDTIRVTIDAKNTTVRLVGIDTPEVRAPGKPVQCYARQASAHTKRLAASSLVYLEADGRSDDRDRYGRLLRYVYLTDGRMLQEELLREGSAFMYPNFPFDRQQAFAALQSEAQTGKVGVWRDCQPVPTARGGFISNPE
jgi:micrococcal nuclease